MNPVEMALGINHAVLETTLASTTALLLVLLARRRLRAAFGATVAYAAWLLVPVASVAVLLPAASPDAVAIPMLHGIVTMPMQVVTASAEPSIRVASWLCAAWLLGVAVMVLHFIRQQRRFRISLGRLRVRGADVLLADAVAGLPAAMGLLNPVIVLPADFETRYSAEQRDLMLVHERVHIRYGDLQANAVLLVLRCVFWFNPLVYFAARAFRHDQELACDQRVIARHPTSRRAYGEAMFRTQLATQMLPLGCHWGFTHPLKERIEMLKTFSPSRARRVVGASLVAMSVLLVGSVAWAAQPAAQAKSGVTSKAVPVRGVSMSPPAYPKDAQDQKLGGNVVLIVDVAADGSVSNATVDRAEPVGIFDASALEAVKGWKFTPAMKNGKPVSSQVRVPISFDPNGDPDKRNAPATTTPARLTMATQASEWNSYDRMVSSFSASWQPPAPATDGC